MQRTIIGRRFASALLTLSGLFFSPVAAAHSPRSDSSYGVSADGLGNVYLSGHTTGSLGGLNAGYEDAFVGQYNAAGTLQWIGQLGTFTGDYNRGVSADGLGNVYLSGYTGGSLGGPSAGGIDAFVSQYDVAGNLQWTRQLGTSYSDVSHGVSADGLGNVYISGYTEGDLGGSRAGGGDAFVAKYNAAGSLQWTRLLGTSNSDASYGVSADGLGNVYISGYTGGNLGGPNAGSVDAFVSKYDEAGNYQWTRQLGTSNSDYGEGVSADGLGNVYIAGYTNGILGGATAGLTDAFVTKYDAAGNLQWTRQVGTVSYDYAQGVSADGLGNVYISGSTRGSLGGPSAGDEDAFVSKYDAAGNLQWIRQLGTSNYDYSFSVSADGLGNVYTSGETGGSLAGAIANSPDAFVSKYDAAGNLQWTRQLGSVPEPAGWLLAALAAAAVLRRATRRARRSIY
jgi:hypothetical protein